MYRKDDNHLDQAYVVRYCPPEKEECVCEGGWMGGPIHTPCQLQ